MKWAALATRPTLIWEAARTAWAFRNRRSIVPSRAVLRWRIATAYGDSRISVRPEDAIRFLAWRRGLRKAIRRLR
ncbi:MAG TPA: hypothetical protein VHL52_10410 [Acidimicrobiia bacterium]|nr:hypothetical protein [Acidimicrobiia bacterium]